MTKSKAALNPSSFSKPNHRKRASSASSDPNPKRRRTTKTLPKTPSAPTPVDTPKDSKDTSLQARIALAKPTWEQLRQHPSRTKHESAQLTTERERIIEKLHSQLGKDNIAPLTRNHTSSRMVQWLFKSSQTPRKQSILSQMMPNICLLASDKYAHHVIIEMLRDTDRDIRKSLVDSLVPLSFELLRNKYGAEVLDFAYQLAATNRQKRAMLINILYGKQRQMYSALLQSKSNLDAVLESKSSRVVVAMADAAGGGALSTAVMESAVDAMRAFCEKPELLRYALVQHAVYEVVEGALNTGHERYGVAVADEICALLQEHIAQLVHTKYGAHLGARIVMLADAKGRKKILKALKSLFVRIAAHEHGHVVILALIDCTDDTVLISKTVFHEFFQSEFTEFEESQVSTENGATEHRKKSTQNAVLSRLCDKYSRLPVLMLVSNWGRRYFSESNYGFICEQQHRIHSKKDTDVRRKELLAYVTPVIERILFNKHGECDSNSVLKLLQSPHSSQVLVEFALSQHEAITSIELDQHIVQGIVDVFISQLSGENSCLIDNSNRIIPCVYHSLSVLSKQSALFQSKLKSRLDSNLKTKLKQLNASNLLFE